MHPYSIVDGRVAVVCVVCKRTCYVSCTPEQALRHAQGTLVQLAMPEVPKEERELLVSGTCGECYRKLIGGAQASFKVEVIADGSGKWCSNALRFATEEQAKAYGDNLFMRWTAVREWRVVPSDDPVTEEAV